MTNQLIAHLPFLLFVGGVAGLAFYLAPSIVAFHREHPHRLAILVVNVLFGATVIGWVGALVWALVTPRTIDLSIPVRVHDASSRQAPVRQGGVPAGGMVLQRREPTFAAVTKDCPSCAETLKAAAVKCRFCGHSLT